MSITIKYAAGSDIGLVRKTNQDSGFASSNLLVLADGMGGAAGGDTASTVAVTYLSTLDNVYPAEELVPRLRYAVEQAHQDLIQRSLNNPQLAGMGTTCIALLRSENKLGMIHIGDSRAYLLRKNKLIQVTHDHTLVQLMVDTGQITAEEAAKHPKRNMVTRALGDSPEVIKLDESIREAVPGDRWLLCSDGLFGVVSHAAITQTLTNQPDLTKCVDELIGMALVAGAPDNITVIVADIVEQNPSATLSTNITTVDSAEVNTPPISSTSPNSHYKNLPSNNTDFSRLPTPVKVGAVATRSIEPLITTPTPDFTLGYGSPPAGFTQYPAKDANPFSTHPSEPSITTKQNNIFAKIFAALGVLVLLSGGLLAGYSWTQTRYYIAPAGEYVAIYKGVPYDIGPLSLNQVHEITNLPVAQLQSFARDRLKSPITRDSLSAAREVVESLRNYTNVKNTTSNSPTYQGTQSESSNSSNSTTPSDTSSTNPVNDTNESTGN